MTPVVKLTEEEYAGDQREFQWGNPGPVDVSNRFWCLRNAEEWIAVIV
jgi:hypothetical protein